MDLVPHAAPPAAYGYPSLWSQYIPPHQCGTVFRIVIGGIVRFFIIIFETTEEAHNEPRNFEDGPSKVEGGSQGGLQQCYLHCEFQTNSSNTNP